MLLVLSCVFTQFVLVYGDYSCLCNYNVEKAVYGKPDSHAKLIGYMYEFDCKSVYGSASQGSNFQTLQFEHQVGYVEMDGSMMVQICQGSIPKEDAIKTTPPHTNALTSTTPIVTTSTSTPSSTTTLPPVSTVILSSPKPTVTSSNPPVTSSLVGLLTNSTQGHSTAHGNTSNTQIGNSTSSNSHKMSTITTNATTPNPTTQTMRPISTTTPTTTQTPTTIPTTTQTPTTTTTTTTKTSTTTPTTTQTPITTTTSTTTPTTVPPPSCQSGWILHGNSCYKFHTHGRKHWHDANIDCVQHSSHLVIIETSGENNFIKHQLDNRIDTHENHDSDTAAWVAGTDDDHEGRWEWYNSLTDTHSQITYDNWRPGQPDEGEHDHDEDCMCMVGSKGFVWEDYSCNEDMFYVCEKSALHTPHVQQMTQAPGTGSQSHGTPKCDNGWILHHESCYMFHTNDRWEWPDANAYCQTHHAHLAIIDSADEHNFLAQALGQRINVHDHDSSDTGTWIAGTDHDNEGHWMWMKGNSLKPIQYSHWQPGEPDHGDGEHEEDCMAMIGNKHFQWNDYRCKENMFFVCERSAFYTNVGSILVG